MSESLLDEEVCPSCGKLVESSSIDELTGWCSDCSPVLQRISYYKDRLETYLAKNANELEHHISQGLSVSKAIDKLHSPDNSNRPTCIVCGKVIKRAQRSAIFCRQQPQCRRYARRYIYLYQEKKLTKAEALAKIFEEIT